jgi:branched-chain amino acid transport system permease protein
LNITYALQIAANGLHNGMIYAVLAYSYVLIYTVNKRANLAHGAVFALSGQLLVMATNLGYNVLILTLAASIVLGAIVSALISATALFALAKVIMPRFIARGPNMMIVATLGVALILLESVRIGSDARELWLPPVLSQHVKLLPFTSGPTIIAVQAINIACFAALIFAAHLILERSAAGRYLRAVADDAGVAALLGINVARVQFNTVFWGSAMAVAAGILAILYFGNMSFGSGLIFGLKVLFISSAGGFSRPLSAALGGFLYGEAEAFWDGYFPIMWREAIFFAFLAGLLCLRHSTRREEV